MHNFADDNTLEGHDTNIDCLINKLENDSNKAIQWFTANHMIANPDKFKAIIVKKNGQDTSGIKLNINNEQIETSKEVTLLGVDLDIKFSLENHVSNLCKSAARILNALKRQCYYITDAKIRSMVVNTYVLYQFNYCPLVWHFCGRGATHKIEKFQERSLRFIHKDYTSEYSDLLIKSNTTTLYLKRDRIIAQEVYKYIQELV